MAPRGRKARVDLVETWDVDDDDGLPDDGLLAGPVHGAVPEEPPGSRGWRRIRRAWPIALVAVVVAGAYLVSGLRERAAFAALQDVLRGQEGFVADLGSELSPVWRVDAGRGRAFPVVVDETIILTTESDGSAALVAVDRTTGTELWRIERDAQEDSIYCGLPFGGGEVAPGSVGCIDRRTELTDDGEHISRIVEVQLRDVRTGEIRDSRAVRHATRAVPWRDAILLVESDSTGTRLRLEGFDGTQRWTMPFLDVTLEEQEYVDLGVWEDRGIVTGRDRAVVVDFDGTVVLDQTVAVHSTVGFPELSVQPVAGGWFALTRLVQITPRTRVYDANGDFAYEIAGDLGSIPLDDGSAGDVLLWRTDSDAALADRTTGETAFRLDRPVEDLPFVLDGALVHDFGGRLRSVDLATGEERWSAPSSGGFVASDGLVVVAFEPMVGGSRLRAFDLGSGQERWVLPFANPHPVVSVASGAVHVHDSSIFSRLGR